MKKRFYKMHKNFNSHTREGVTMHIVEFFKTLDDFNSHTREGVTVNSLRAA